MFAKFRLYFSEEVPQNTNLGFEFNTEEHFHDPAAAVFQSFWVSQYVAEIRGSSSNAPVSFLKESDMSGLE